MAEHKFPTHPDAHGGGPPPRRRTDDESLLDEEDDAIERIDGDPTPDEIQRLAEEIRGRWSDRVKKKRHLTAPSTWTVPDVPVADIDPS